MANKYRQLFPRPIWLATTIGLPEEFVNWLLRAWNIIGQVEEWHEVGATNEPAFENSWTNYGAGYETAAFYKDPFGRVHLKGMIKSGTNNTAAFTLPVGYRPAAYLMFSQMSSGPVDCATIIQGDGVVRPNSTSSGTWNTLDGISFRAEQ